MPAKPRIFIGSSSEVKLLAEQVATQLANDATALGWWVSPEFINGFATLDGLLKAVETYDFAVFLFTPDDRCTSRNKTHQVPRDNVVFEYGLFLGRLGKARTLAYRQHSAVSPLKLPSDVAGIYMPVITGTTDKHEAIASAITIVADVQAAIAQCSDWWRMELKVVSEWGIDSAKKIFWVNLSVPVIRENIETFKDKKLLLGIRIRDAHVSNIDDPDIEFGSPRSVSKLDTAIQLIVKSRSIIPTISEGDVIEAYVFLVPNDFHQAKTIAEAVNEGGRLVGAVGQRIERKMENSKLKVKTGVFKRTKASRRK